MTAPPEGARVVDRFRLEIPGPPVPWARAGKSGKRHYTPAPQAAHMTAIKRAWMMAGRPHIHGPVSVSMQFYLPHPASHYGTGRNTRVLRPSAPTFHTSKPDKSNLEKIVEDALNGLAWIDDAYIICGAGVTKLYADQPRDARTVLEAWLPAGAVT